MARKNKTVWRAATRDQNYSGHSFTFLLTGENAAAVEEKALKLAERQVFAGPDDKPADPYIASIELVGDLDG